MQIALTVVRAVASTVVVALLPCFGYAQERFERREHGREHFRHEHIYPAFGYSVTVLPTGNVAVTFGSGRYYFHEGVWYQPAGAGFVVVRPPVGIAVPVLPPDYTTVSVGGVPYYYANETYYVAGPSGYVVAQPVQGSPVAPAPQVATAYPPAPAPAPVQAPQAVVVPAQPVTVLPPGYATVTYRKASFYFSAGVWYRKRSGRFVVVRPPVGIAVQALPPTATSVVIAGTPYYYANETYYVAGPGGYVVAQPPTAPGPVQAPPPQTAAPQVPAPQPQASAPQSPGGIWYYCESTKTYYPYVQTCSEGWRSVPAAPPQAPR